MAEHSKKDPFQNISAANSCDVAWKEMGGTDRVRSCPSCTFRVYDFADLSETAVADLLAENEKLEVSQMFRRDDGMYMLKKCPARQNWMSTGSADVPWERFAYHTDGAFQPGWQQNDLFKGGWTMANTNVKWTYGRSVIGLQERACDSGAFTVFEGVYQRPSDVRGDFRFKVYPKTPFLSDLAKKFFGTQDIIIGDPAFDDMMVVQGDDEDKVRALWQDEQMRTLLMHLRSLECSMGPDEKSVSFMRGLSSSSIVLRTIGLVVDQDYLSDSLKLMKLLLDRLKELGLAL